VDAAGIQLVSITKRFLHGGGARDAVRDVSLEVAPGRFLTLLGPSGCGKTTTLRIVAGFEAPTSGRVLIGGTDVTGLMANRRNIGFVFQHYALFPHLPVGENVAYGLRVRKWSAREITRAVGDVLALVGLAGYERRFPHQLSGGEQQRVALARAVVIRPQVLLFDEPLSNLDAKLRVQMRAEIRRLQETLAITTVYVTHDQDEAMAISDRIAVMQEGRIVQVGTAEDVYARPATTFIAEFIGRMNVIEAEARPDGPGSAVEVNGQTLRLGAGPPRLGRVRLGVRPETIELSRPSAGLVPGLVESRTFLGEKVEYVVRWGALRLQVTAYDPIRRGTFAPGDGVAVTLTEGAVHVLSEDDAVRGLNAEGAGRAVSRDDR
jgi:iron(III) transport system ATP-binding protein